MTLSESKELMSCHIFAHLESHCVFCCLQALMWPFCCFICIFLFATKVVKPHCIQLKTEKLFSRLLRRHLTPKCFSFLFDFLTFILTSMKHYRIISSLKKIITFVAFFSAFVLILGPIFCINSLF